MASFHPISHFPDQGRGRAALNILRCFKSGTNQPQFTSTLNLVPKETNFGKRLTREVEGARTSIVQLSMSARYRDYVFYVCIL